MKILLSDDSQFMRTVLKGICETVFPGAQYFEAENGEEAIAIGEKESPDLLLLDLIMPGKGGIDVLKDIDKSKIGTIFVISAMGQDKIIEEAKTLGAKNFIVKPFEEDKVVELLKEIA